MVAMEIGRSLAGLYAYMQNRLLEANSKQTDAPLAEVESLLATLGEGWATAKLPARAVEAEAYEPVSCVY